MGSLDDIRALLPDLEHDQLAALIDDLPDPAAEALLRELDENIHTNQADIPAGPLEQAQQIDVGYRARPHLTYLSRRLAEAVRDVEQGRSRRLMVEMPPRSGKSILSSVYLPVWLLRSHPTWKLGLVSHSPHLAVSWGRQVRRLIEGHGPRLGLAIAKDAGAAADWQTTQGGGITSRSAGQSIVGLGFKVLLIDDIVKDFASAHSAAYREQIWDWWQADALTRLEPPSLVIAVACMTGDTPVMRPDGTETPLRDIRPGDQIASYDRGCVVISTVSNWANQGPDDIFAIRMASGRTVRANARHPFLTITEDGTEEWRRVQQLTPGMMLVSASLTNATGNQSPGGCAASTTPGSRTITHVSRPTGQVSPARQSGVTSPSNPRANASITLPVDGPARSENVRDSSTNGSGLGEGCHAAPTDATGPQPAKASAHRTTTRTDGPRDIDPHQSTPPRAAKRSCDTATASPHPTTTGYSRSKVAAAPSVADNQATGLQPIGVGNSASTTSTTPEPSEVCSATTATSCSRGTSRLNASGLTLTTWNVGTDRVVSITPAGREDVFDVQVDRTENFVANGLASHNTRWHEDDFLGRLLSPEHDGDPAEWEEISFPAIAEGADVLGRKPGQPLYSPLLEETEPEALERWADLRRSVGSYAWSSLYQQSPSPAQGAIFNTEWWRYWTADPNKATDDGRIVYLNPLADLKQAKWLDSWDMAFKATADSDYVVGQRWARHGTRRYLLAQQRDRWTFTQTLEAMLRWGDGGGPWGHLVHQRLVEDKANGTAILDTLKDKISGLIPVNPTESKEARARAITPEVEAGNVYLPHPADPGNEWVTDLLAELREFPSGAHDDQCLIGSTRVETPEGPRRIDSIQAGDIVLGQTGWVEVLAAGQTGVSPVITYAGLTGTSGHPIWTGRGWIPLSQLHYDDVLCRVNVPSPDASDNPRLEDFASCTTSVGRNTATRRSEPSNNARSASAPPTDARRFSLATRNPNSAANIGSPEVRRGLSPSSTAASSSADTQMRRRLRTAATSSLAEPKQPKALTLFTARSTKTITAQSPTAGTSTTAITTTRTTAPTTSSHSRPVRVATGTSTTTSATSTTKPKPASTSTGSAKRPQSGIDPKRDERGIESTASELPRRMPRKSASDSLQPKPTAAPIAGTDLTKVGPQPVNGPASSGSRLGLPERPVFNLTTTDGTYFANDILVHNCDALTQALSRLRDPGRGRLTVPGRLQSGPVRRSLGGNSTRAGYRRAAR